MVEQMTPDVEREAQDETEAQEFLAMLEKTYADAGAKLRAARSQLERAQRDMGRAEQRREMAERQAEAARQAAGLSHTTSSLNVALKAMQDAAAKDLMAAEAAGAKARLLTADAAREGRPQHCRRARRGLRDPGHRHRLCRSASRHSKRARAEPLTLPGLTGAAQQGAARLPSPVERHTHVGGHPGPGRASPGFPLSRE